jgi:SAM-dependent methyltransferase
MRPPKEADMNTAIDAYLQAVGVTDGVVAREVACEVCGEHDHDVVVDEVETLEGRTDKLPVVACRHCGYLYQNPRFNRGFYQAYYEKHYRRTLFGSTAPAKDFIADQLRRGVHLYRSLAPYLPKGGRMLDVGCSSGGMMVAFAKQGWQVAGNDPDANYAAYGRAHLRLDIETVCAEDMCLPAARFDLITIIGSLEHVYDVNQVLARCRQACAPNGLLLIEGRAHGYGVIKGHFSHNHRRYLTLDSIEMLMLRHGWNPILSTDAPLCGPTRPGAVHVLGKACEPIHAQTLRALMAQRWPQRRIRAIGALEGLKGFVGGLAVNSLVEGEVR